MRLWLVKIVILLAGVCLASSAVAQDDDRPKMRAKVLVDKDSGVSVTRPEGWIIGKTKNGGTVAVFKAAGDADAQIDVLVSPVEGKEAASAYFTSFHADLQKVGLVKKNVRKEASYEGKVGIETEYDAASRDRQFRLVLWQFHQGKRAVIVTGFFPTTERDNFYGDLQKVIESIELKK
jgi:hypothetical protein